MSLAIALPLVSCAPSAPAEEKYVTFLSLSDLTGPAAGLTYTIGLDEGTDIAANYRIVGIPTHFFVDRDGVLREWRIGALSKKNMEKKVDEIMASASEGAGQ